MRLLIKKIKRVKLISLNRAAALTVVAVAVFGGFSCGKRKPPQPPKESVVQRVQINGLQRGDRITLVWKMPARNASGASVLNIDRVDIYRLAEPLASPISLTEEEFSKRSTLIGSIAVNDSDFGLKEKSYTDVLRFAGQPVRLRYAIRFVNASGQKAAFSNFLLIEPTARVAFAPDGVRVSVEQDAINVSWNAPEKNVDGSKPANIAGFNVYRKDGSGSGKRLNGASAAASSPYRDEFFDFEKEYTYFVRTVSVGGDGEQLESLSSEEVRIKPLDTFPPAAPGALTIAASPNIISIFFAANVEKDIEGYNVYRSTDKELDLSKWELVTAKPLAVTTFQDKAVRANVTYYYYIKALDKYGNVSGPSVIVSEKAF